MEATSHCERIGAIAGRSSLATGHPRALPEKAGGGPLLSTTAACTGSQGAHPRAKGLVEQLYKPS
jgi:hypothetical protein